MNNRKNKKDRFHCLEDSFLICENGDEKRMLRFVAFVKTICSSIIAVIFCGKINTLANL